MKKQSIFLVLFALILLLSVTSKIYAGKGAYLKVYNLTNTTLSISSANIGMDRFTNKNENASSGQMLDFDYIEEARRFNNSDFTIFASKAGEGECRIKVKISGGSYYLDESDSNGLTAYAHITYPDNQFRVNIYITYPNNRWMTRNSKIQNSTLSEFCMPGAHDAAMGKVEDCSTYANDKVTQTQDKNFKELLNLGVRYFDLRTILDNNGNWRFGHYSYTGADQPVIGVLGFQGCMGYDLDNLLLDLVNFLNEKGNKELVVLEFSHFVNLKRNGLKTGTKYDNFDTEAEFDGQDFELLVGKIKNALEGHLVVTDSNNLTNIKVSEFTGEGGKALVLIDDNNFKPVYGAYPLKYLKKEGGYADKDSFKPMKKDQLEKLASRNVDSNFQMSWTLTQQSSDVGNFVACFAESKWYLNIPAKILANSKCVSIRDMAIKANNELFGIVNEAKSINKYPNVLYTDYISNEHQIVVSTLLNLNR